MHPASINGLSGPDGGASFEVPAPKAEGPALEGPSGGLSMPVLAGGLGEALAGPLEGFAMEPEPRPFGGAVDAAGVDTTGGEVDGLSKSPFSEQQGVTTIES